MEALTLNQIALAVHGRLLGAGIDGESTVTEVSTDSRKIKKGCLFLPLVGEKFDGHDYIASALEMGAAGCITARAVEERQPGKFYIRWRTPRTPCGIWPPSTGGCSPSRWWR